LEKKGNSISMLRLWGFEIRLRRFPQKESRVGKETPPLLQVET